MSISTQAGVSPQISSSWSCRRVDAGPPRYGEDGEGEQPGEDCSTRNGLQDAARQALIHDEDAAQMAPGGIETSSMVGELSRCWGRGGGYLHPELGGR